MQREIPLRNAQVKSNCNVLLLSFKDYYSVEFCAYNNGVAYRFITKKKSEIEVRDEEISLKFPTEFGAVWSPSKSFKTAYEIPYKKVTTTEIIEMEKSTLPVLLNNLSSILKKHQLI